MRTLPSDELLSEGVLACATKVKFQLMQEIDRLFEELHGDLVNQVGTAQERHQNLDVQMRAADQAVVGHPQESFSSGGIDGEASEGYRLPSAPEEGTAGEKSAALQQPLQATSRSPRLTPRQRAAARREEQLENQQSEEQAYGGDLPSSADESLRNEASKILNVQIEEQPLKDADQAAEDRVLRFETDEAIVVDSAPTGKSVMDVVYRTTTGVRSRSSELWLKRRSSHYAPGRDNAYPALKFIVNSRFFEIFFALVILLNCVTMGFQAEQTVNGPSNAGLFTVLEHCFTALFTIELLMRLSVYGWRGFIPCGPWSQSSDNWWNFVDACLVVFTGILFSWIVPLMKAIVGSDRDSSGARTLTTLLAARLLRLARVVRRVPQFREVWLLLRGLTDSMRVLFWTCVVIVTITYIFAVFGLVLITKELIERRNISQDEELRQEITELLEFVGGLGYLMYTLIQLLTLDSWNGIVRRLVKQIGWCWAYFYAYIAVAVFVLMNLVTAIIVENAVTNSKHDEDHLIKAREKSKLEELKSLENLFKLMDADGSGTLSWDEFKAAFDDTEMSKKWKLLDFDPDECKELFSLLDDGDGEIETTEFFEGLAQMKGMAQSKDVFRLRKYLDKLKDSFEDMKEGMEAEAEQRSKSSKAEDEKRVEMVSRILIKEIAVQTHEEEATTWDWLPNSFRKAHKNSEAPQAPNDSEIPMLIPASGAAKLHDEAWEEAPLMVPSSLGPVNPGSKLQRI